MITKKYKAKDNQELSEIIFQYYYNKNHPLLKDNNIKVLNDIDVSNITNMSRLFSGKNMDEDLSSWNVANVINMESIFYGCKNFNQTFLKIWKMKNVVNTSSMLRGCDSFKQDLSNLDLPNVINTTDMTKYKHFKLSKSPRFSYELLLKSSPKFKLILKNNQKDQIIMILEKSSDINSFELKMLKTKEVKEIKLYLLNRGK